jgi:NADH:ubiquinone oxidoreductase subunit 2 (subunit N)
MSVALLPLVIVSLGVIFLSSLFIIKEKFENNQIRIFSLIIIATSFVSLALIKNQSPIYAFRGGISIDGTSQMLGLMILLVLGVAQIILYLSKEKTSNHAEILLLIFCFFSLFAVFSNRVSFGVLAVFSMMIAGQGAMLSEVPKDLQVDYSSAALRKMFFYFLFSGVVTVLCLIYFGETQYDEMQIFLNRAKEPVKNIVALQILFVVHALIVTNIPPFTGILSTTRRAGSWSLSFAVSTAFSLVGFGLFIKSVIYLSTRVGVGANELEPLLGSPILFLAKIIISIALILCPLLALIQKNLKQSFLIFIANAFAHCLIAIAYAQKEIMSFSLGAVVEVVVASMILMNAKNILGLTNNSKLEDWVGIGQKNKISTVVLLVAIWSIAGFSPFFSGLLNQKTLCINSQFSVLIVLNTLAAGFYALRLTVLAFQKPLTGNISAFELRNLEKYFSVGMVILLILMGIFSQPLYKYGTYSIRHLFGEF